MKKKFLSLMMAAAVVATTSVSAFAEVETEGTQPAVGTPAVSTPTVSAVGGKINGTDDKEYTTEVQIKGDVEDQKGAVLPGTLSVTVPTAATFRVASNNQLQGTSINVKNDGTQDIDVFAYEFRDTTENGGITVLGKNELNSRNRTNITLNLRGNVTTAYLGSKRGDSKGIYSDENLSKESPELKIAKVPQGGEKELELSGEAGSTGEVSNPVNDIFTLVLKIKKATE